MKKLSILCLVILAAFATVSCGKSEEQKICEEFTLKMLKAPSSYKFVSFEPVLEMTLADEFDICIGNLERNFKMDEDMVKSQREWLETATTDDYGVEFIQSRRTDYEKDSAKLETTRKNLESLKALKETKSGELSNVTFREYALEYDAQNAMGAMLRGKMIFHMNANNEIVAFQEEGGSWNIIGKFFSIDEYYDFINQE